MPEEVRRRAAARRRRIGEDAARNGERADHARRDERGELRLVSRAHAGENRVRDAVHESEACHVNRHRTFFRKDERSGGNVEERVLRRRDDRPRVERERGGVRHRHRVRERRTCVHDDRVGLRNRRISEEQRGAVVHSGGAVAKRARKFHGGEAAVQNRTARVLLQAVLHNHLALAFLHDDACIGCGAGIERDGVSGGVDRQRLAVKVEPPVVLLRSI